ncbi:succinylglutamate-semialdehyde dehydrogenase [Novosphingobium pentaromativorans]|uniref:Succinylglutamic semialdehyde dehydrogenase n=1 Tax=Novosphingobium pentaromativorans US6-1 TaxID=1088721 RepID=G6EA34_9SPHN|nr:succinylglutamate-semialdehyde dehydrogenase [Novosphingobium pentaromativorans]AIT80823.1 succinylglutamate-semialdehyde dehydrogenase [Novosphingobium pentaromativorans US6-1]EHJ61891.1 succinylglutamic semialdehyde dehydrogenase [Novosphingobium pentaromativorans US6-1]
MSHIQSIDPATGAVVWEGAAAGRAEVDAALRRARRAFPGWAALAVEDRVAAVQRFKAVLEARKEQIAAIISRETGKPRWEGLAELGSMIGKVGISITAQAERAGERRSDMPFGAAVLRHRPHGVMAVLGPFNFPGHLPNGHIVPALLAGNTVVFKPSEMTPATGAAMAEAWAEAGLPEGVFQCIQGARETGEALVSGAIDGLLFTGSAGAGAHFRHLFADRPDVILALELGGNNPLVAWDGDVEEAAAIVVQSAFVTTGQRCSCARRLIVPDTAFGNDLVEAVAHLSGRLLIGAWDETPEPYIGPLISSGAAAKARAQFEVLVERGARVVEPFGSVEDRSAAFVRPAMLDVTGVSVPDEEIFAPVLQVCRVADFDAAMAAANDTRFGLSAGLVSADDGLWQRFVLESRAGVVNRNRPTTGAAGSMPFGGLGESGNHRPSAYYAADYCAYPMASFEASDASGNMGALDGKLR